MADETAAEKATNRANGNNKTITIMGIMLAASLSFCALLILNSLTGTAALKETVSDAQELCAVNQVEINTLKVQRTEDQDAVLRAITEVKEQIKELRTELRRRP